MAINKMTTPEQHRWFHENRPDKNVGSCCWCASDQDLKERLDKLEKRLIHLENIVFELT